MDSPCADAAGAQPLIASPTTATALPQTVTGALTGTLTWFPPKTEWLPEVVCELADAPLADAAVSQPLIARPSTAAAFPQTVTGTLTGTLTWLPPNTEWLPEVVCELADALLADVLLCDAAWCEVLWCDVLLCDALLCDALLADAADSHPPNASPSTAMALPHTVAGIDNGALTWFPLKMPPLPVVEPATATPVPPAANTVVRTANLAVRAAHVVLLI